MKYAVKKIKVRVSKTGKDVFGYAVVSETGTTQSVWTDLMQARQVARDLTARS